MAPVRGSSSPLPAAPQTAPGALGIFSVVTWAAALRVFLWSPRQRLPSPRPAGGGHISSWHFLGHAWLIDFGFLMSYPSA